MSNVNRNPKTLLSLCQESNHGQLLCCRLKFGLELCSCNILGLNLRQDKLVELIYPRSWNFSGIKHDKKDLVVKTTSCLKIISHVWYHKGRGGGMATDLC